MKLAALAVLSLCGAALSGPPDRGPERPARHLNSPNGPVGFELARDEANRLVYTVTLGRDVVVEPSPLGVMVDGKNLAAGSVTAGIDRYDIDEKYAWLGVHSTATNRCHGARVAFSGWTLDARASASGCGRTATRSPRATGNGPFSTSSAKCAVGAKIDFFDHEGKEMIDRFHGANKPAGQTRTQSNELVRDDLDEPATVRIEKTTVMSGTLAIDMRAGGGFIGRFVVGRR